MVQDKIRIEEKRTDIKYILTVELSPDEIVELRGMSLTPSEPTVLKLIVSHLRELTSEGYFDK